MTETRAGIEELRRLAYLRSQGICECERKECRGRFVTFKEGHLHHVKVAHSRSDTLEQVRFIRPDCHEAITGKLQFSWSKQ